MHPCEPLWLENDVWFQYVATRTGEMVVSLCDNAAWDGAVAIYSNGTGLCTCPTSDASPIACNDERCVPSGGAPEVKVAVQESVCYVIQIGGRDAAQTAGVFEITYKEHGCPYPVPAPAQGDPVVTKRIKYVAFSAPGGEARPNVVRMTLTASAQFPGSVGKSWWVGQPRLVSEVAGKKDATPPTFWAAELQETSYASDWSQYPMVHVYGRGIAPSCTYEVSLAPQGCEQFPAAYSVPATIQTSKWGDAVGINCAAPPNGVVDFTDIACVVDKFKNSGTAPAKSRVDIASGTPCMVDQIVDFIDIPAFVDAFRGVQYSAACAP